MKYDETMCDLSIVVPAYNMERFIQETIDSLINQRTNYSYEIIVVNDGSTDETLSILDHQYKDNEHIKIYTKRNGGLSSARNYGISKAKGKFICFVDSDDLLVPNMVEDSLNIIYEKDLDLFMFSATSFFEGDYKGEWLPPKYIRSNSKVLSGENQLIEQYLKSKFISSACMYITRLSNIKDNSLYFPEGINHEDNYFTYFNLILSQRSISVSQELYSRRIRSDSIMTGSSEFDRFNNYSKLLLKILEDSSSFPKIKKKYKNLHLFTIFTLIVYSYNKLDCFTRKKNQRLYKSVSKKMFVLSPTRYFLVIIKKYIKKYVINELV